MRIKYITVNIGTLKGVKEAEQLKNKGWKIGSFGFNTIQFYKKEKKKTIKKIKRKQTQKIKIKITSQQKHKQTKHKKIERK